MNTLHLDDRDLDDIRKAKAAWERNIRTDIESPEWDQVSREWAERSQALAHMLFAKLDKLPPSQQKGTTP